MVYASRSVPINAKTLGKWIVTGSVGSDRVGEEFLGLADGRGAQFAVDTL